MWACLPAGPLERRYLEGVLEGIGEGVPYNRDLQKGWNTYLWKDSIRGSLCLLIDWTPPLDNWLLKVFHEFCRNAFCTKADMVEVLSCRKKKELAILKQ